MKIAKLFAGDPNNQKGAFNNILERCKRLAEVEADVDCYIIRYYHSFFLRVLKKRFKKPQLEDEIVVQGLRFKNLWVEMDFWDYIFSILLKQRLPVGRRQLIRYVENFSQYDLLSVHGYGAVFIADKCKERFNIPFVATWHGSDINYTPFFSNTLYKKAKFYLERADHNFFVSQKLLEKSELISSIAKKSVLYTGPSQLFYDNINQLNSSIPKRLDFPSDNVIAFVGNLIDVKNVLCLPDIFKAVKARFEDVCFLIVGDGDLQEKLERRLHKLGLHKDVIMTGKMMPNDVPHIMRKVDILVLPSKNEGLPLVTLEAQLVGAAVVGSDRGGIPESIGIENSFALENDFVERISGRIIELLRSGERPSGLPEKFSWEYALRREKEVHESLVRAR